EGGIDVSSIDLNGNFCTPTYLVETRNSTSVDGLLQDFALGTISPTVIILPPLTPVCEQTPATLPINVSGTVAPYSLVGATSSDPNRLPIDIRLIGATTPGGSPGTYQIIARAVDGRGCEGFGVTNLTILANPTCSLSAPNQPPVCGSPNNTIRGPS